MPEKFTYLAGPYSHPDPTVSLERFELLNKKAAELMAQHILVFSPISHSHPIAMAGELPKDWAFWERFCAASLANCERVLVYALPGWEDSVGVKAEVAMAVRLGIPVGFIYPE